MRTQYIFKHEFEHLLAALMPANRLAMEISLATGLRISDVLNIRTAQIMRPDGRFTVRELKTDKTRRVYMPSELHGRAIEMAGRYFLFPGRNTALKPRTRQAVFKDIKRVAKVFRLAVNVAPHSARKIYAVEQYRRDGDLVRVQKLLNHSHEAVTVLYALADQAAMRTARPNPTKGGARRGGPTGNRPQGGPNDRRGGTAETNE